jgi:hypothetical protein
MKKQICIAFVITVLAACSQYVRADMLGGYMGDGTPPSTVGGYSMVEFPTDPQPYGQIASVASPVGGFIDFSTDLFHTTAGSSGAAWGNGYTGDAYTSTKSGVVMTMPVNTFAVDFFAQPASPVPYDIVATATDGKTLELSVTGNDEEQGFEFYAQKGETIASLSLSVPPTAGGFTIGQIGIDPVPEPSTISLFGAGAAAMVLAVWRRAVTARLA